MIQILIPLNKVPRNGEITKRTGTKKYIVKDELTIYQSGESKNTVIQCDKGCRFIVSPSDGTIAAMGEIWNALGVEDNVMPELEVSFEVYCGECGAGMCNNATVRYSRRREEPQIVIAPCETCIQRAKEPLEERIEELEANLTSIREGLD